MIGEEERYISELFNQEYNNCDYNKDEYIGDDCSNNNEIIENDCSSNNCSDGAGRDGEDFRERLNRIESEDNFTAMNCENCQYFITYYYNCSGVCLLDHNETDVDDSCSRWSEGNKIKMAKETIHGLFNISINDE